MKLGTLLFFFLQNTLCEFSACYLICYFVFYWHKPTSFFFLSFHAISLQRTHSARRRKNFSVLTFAISLSLTLNQLQADLQSFLSHTASKDHLLSVFDFQKSKLNLEVIKVHPLLRLLEFTVIKSNRCNIRNRSLYKQREVFFFEGDGAEIFEKA